MEYDLILNDFQFSLEKGQKKRVEMTLGRESRLHKYGETQHLKRKYFELFPILYLNSSPFSSNGFSKTLVRFILVFPWEIKEGLWSCWWVSWTTERQKAIKRYEEETRKKTNPRATSILEKANNWGLQLTHTLQEFSEISGFISAR